MTRPFVNWARNVRSAPRAWAAPTSEDEVVSLVRETHARGGRLRVCGSRHSWSPIAASDDVQVELTGLDGVVSVDIDLQTITVQGGCKLRTLNEALARHGLAMPILGSITEQAIAGAVATGTHGSSLRHGNLGSLIQGLRLVDGRGEVVEIGADDARLPGARVHLGALGVITEVTLGVDRAFGLIETRTRMPLDDAADALAALAATHEYVKVWWLPPCDDVLVTTYTRTNEPVSRSRVEAAWERVANATLFPALLGAGGVIPALIPSIMRLVDRVHFLPGTRSGKSAEMFTLVMPPRHQETELAFDASLAGQSLRALRDLVQATGARLDFLSELRFVKGDANWMSPAYGRDTCQLGLYATHSPDIPRAFAAFRELGRAWEARPHWGKSFETTPDEIDALYPRAADFRALAADLDPDRVFRNPFVDQILGAA